MSKVLEISAIIMMVGIVVVAFSMFFLPRPWKKLVSWLLREKKEATPSGEEGSPAEPPAPEKPLEMVAARRSSTQWIGRVVEWAFGLVVCGLFFATVWLLAKFISAPSWQRWLPLALEAIFIGFWCLVFWPIIKRWLADFNRDYDSWFWFRSRKEMQTVYVLKNGVLCKTVVSCNNREKRVRMAFALAYGWNIATSGEAMPQRTLEQSIRLFEELREILCNSLGQLLDSVDGPYPAMSQEALAALQPLVFLGHEPIWLGPPWSFTIDDGVRDLVDIEQTEPYSSLQLDLSERVIDLEPEEMFTGDRIEVKSHLVVYGESLDPTKTRYGTVNYLEAIKKAVEGVWRQVIADLRFFEYDFAKLMEKRATPPTEAKEAPAKAQLPLEEAITRIHSQSQQILSERLGLKEERELGEQWLAGLGKEMATCFHGWGFRVRLVVVRDIDVVNPAIRAFFEKIAQSRVNLLVALQAAEATRVTTAAPYDGKREALEKMITALKVDGAMLLTWDRLPEILEGMNTTLIGEGAVAQALGLLRSGALILGGGSPSTKLDEAVSSVAPAPTSQPAAKPPESR